MKLGDRFGGHRVIEPKGSLPKAAERVDNQTPPLENEIGIKVNTLHITSASFNRLWNESNQDEKRFTRKLHEIVNQRGKYQDPVSGSGGVLMGTVAFVGSTLKVNLQPGEPIVSMVSLSLTPLRLDRVIAVNPLMGQVEVEGYAVLFESGTWARIPNDLPAPLALMALDVAGAPAYAARYVKEGQRVIVLGGGKAGMLCLHEAKKQTGKSGQVILVEKDSERGEMALSLGVADELILADATQSLDVFRKVGDLTNGALADVSFDCANLPNTEMSLILSTRDDGRIIFFSMATDFSRAALGAEGAGKSVEMIIGNGYVPGHARLALQALRDNKPLCAYLSGLLSRSQNLAVTSMKGGVPT